MANFEEAHVSDAELTPLDKVEDIDRELVISAEDVKAEHMEAYNALTPAQHEVFRRLREVENAGNFNNKSWEERFNDACFNEARSRRARKRYDLGLPATQ